MTTLVYIVMGVVCAICLRVTKKGVSFIIPFVFLGCGELKVLCGDAVACELVNFMFPCLIWSIVAPLDFHLVLVSHRKG